VIGGGLGGLAAACVLGARGHKVTLYDKNDWIGGKAAVLHEGGFRFDMGPTILTVPRVLLRIFGEANRNIADYLDLVRLDPQWRCFFDDGTQIDLEENIDRMAAEMDRFAPGSGAGEGYKRFQGISEHLHDVSNRFSSGSPWKTSSTPSTSAPISIPRR
jgi:phytoene dehydrogenase-like protein